MFCPFSRQVRMFSLSMGCIHPISGFTDSIPHVTRLDIAWVLGESIDLHVLLHIMYYIYVKIVIFFSLHILRALQHYTNGLCKFSINFSFLVLKVFQITTSRREFLLFRSCEFLLFTKLNNFLKLILISKIQLLLLLNLFS